MEVQVVKKQLDEEQFKKLHFHPTQEVFINELADFLHSGTPIHVSAMRGFIYRACREWQLRNRKLFSSIMNLGNIEMFKFWIQFSNLIIEVTRRVIKAENELEFERKLGKAYSTYQARFSNV